MIDDIQDRRLNKLCFHDRSNHFQKRFLRKYDCSLRDGIDVTAEVEAAQIMKEIFFEDSKTS